MFKDIFIKSQKATNTLFDIAFLIECMLFYGKVRVVVHEKEVSYLLRHFGQDLLKELICSGRIELCFKHYQIAVSSFPSAKKSYSLELYGQVDEDLSAILYRSHKAHQNNGVKNMKFAEEFEPLINRFSYSDEFSDNFDLNNFDPTLLRKSIAFYFKEIVPNWTPNEPIEIEITEAPDYGPFKAKYFDTNLDLNILNKMHLKNVGEDNYHELTYSGFLHAFAESQGDTNIASQFRTEIVADDLYSKFISLHLNHLVQKRNTSQENIDSFEESILEHCHPIGEAFVQNIISAKELLELLNEADKFRDWLEGVPEDKKLINEYYKEVTKDRFKKLPNKYVRFLLFSSAVIAASTTIVNPVVGTVAATAVSALDNLYLDQLLKDKTWTPNQFIDQSVKPVLGR